MEALFKVNPAECTLCYACIRRCPVKAIDIDFKAEKAHIDDDRCIGCGICYNICPQSAISYRQNNDDVEALLKKPGLKVALCDPSISAEFEDITEYKKFAGMLKTLGFDKIYETAFAVDVMANKYKELYDNAKGKYYINTYCSTVVEYVEKYIPELMINLAPVASPIMIASEITRKIHESEDVSITYITSCISVKREVEKYEKAFRPDTIITFYELRKLFSKHNITESSTEFYDFDKPFANKGYLYPISSGILDAMDMYESNLDSIITTIDGDDGINDALNAFSKNFTDIAKHINPFYCKGCLSGPGMGVNNSRYQRASAVSRYAKKRLSNHDDKQFEDDLKSYGSISAKPIFKLNDQRREKLNYADVEQVISTLHNLPVKDEGCGACGFDNCEGLAEGIIHGYANADMCLRRTINSQKAYTKFKVQSDERIKMLKEEITLLRSSSDSNEKSLHEYQNMLSKTINILAAGIIIVDKNLHIYEANDSLIKVIGEEAEIINEVVPGLKGADLHSMLPSSVCSMFEYAIENNESVTKDVTVNGTKFVLSVFNIAEKELSGGIFRPFHSEGVRYEEFEKRILDVIDQNLLMVQNIGFLLGEGISNTEKMLNSVIDSFKKQKK
ncbi:MAG: [Fe-Fe] hydrogenase large subunit C-terminal domain-containing protein [Bacteroidales bacterium]